MSYQKAKDYFILSSVLFFGKHIFVIIFREFFRVPTFASNHAESRTKGE